MLRSIPRRVARAIGRFTGEVLGLVPALLAGAGVFLVVAGLFYYLQPASADATATPSPSPIYSSALYSVPPIKSAGPSGSASVQAAIATRIKVPALAIDLPIIQSPPNEQFPLCNTAEYLSLDKVFAYPGLAQSTYIYAHARTGMFWPLLATSRVNNGGSMIGMWVEVYTDDNQRHVYEITEVIRGVPDVASSLDRALGAKTDQLWMQTSEGPKESSTKLQIVAQPIGVLAATPADAHPAGRGNVCADAPKCKTPTSSGCRPA